MTKPLINLVSVIQCYLTSVSDSSVVIHTGLFGETEHTPGLQSANLVEVKNKHSVKLCGRKILHKAVLVTAKVKNKHSDTFGDFCENYSDLCAKSCGVLLGHKRCLSCHGIAGSTWLTMTVTLFLTLFSVITRRFTRGKFLMVNTIRSFE